MSGLVAAAALMMVPEPAAVPVGAVQAGQPAALALSPQTPHEDRGEHDILVSAVSPHAKGDPFQSVNATSFAVTQDVDRAVIGPVALAFRSVMPKPLRDGLRNGLRNLNEPVIAVNFLLQIKPGRALGTVARFAVNSTIGVGGLFDMARRRPFKLRRRVNGLAYTMGYYGIRPGPFFYVPLVGPTTLRDALGGGVDRLMVPFALGAPFNQAVYSVPTGGFSMLDRRIEIDEQIHRLRDGNPDPYAAFRAAYLNRRQAEIDELRGLGPAEPAR